MSPVDRSGQPAGAKGRRKPPLRRLLIGVMAAVAIVAAIAAAATPRGGQRGGSQPPAQAGKARGATGASSQVGQNAALRSLQKAPEPSASVAKSTLARQSRTAFALARNYENTASRIEGLGSGSSGNADLVAALRQTGSAYQAAGTAAAAGDSAGYTAAIASAGDGKTAIQSALAGKSAGTPSPTNSSPGTSSSSSCAGDSQSDDPSDDSCGGDP
jgi:hypothetical protein